MWTCSHVIRYEMIKSMAGVLQRTTWSYIVCDEAHMLKNEETEVAGVVCKLRAAHKLLITGTPLQNNRATMPEGGGAPSLAS